MKTRKWKMGLSALLAAAMLITGCGTQTVETTLPLETTVSAETSVPVETTVPETTEPVIEDNYEERLAQCLAEQGFEPFDYYQRYVGESNEIVFDDVGFTLTVPEEWMDEVEILRYGGGLEDYFGVLIINRRLAEEYHGEIINDAFVVHFEAERKMATYRPMPRAETYTDEYTNTSNYLGENNEYYFYYTTAEMSGGMETPAFWKYFIVIEEGLDYYNDLVGDLIADPEEVPGWVTIQDTPEEYVQEKPAQYLENHPEFEWTGMQEVYRYCGEDGVIEFPEWGFTLTLPESWLDGVEVVYSPNLYSEFAIYVMNKEITELIPECRGRNPYLQPEYSEYILRIYCDDRIPGPCWVLDQEKGQFLIAETREQAFLSENEEFYSGLIYGRDAVIYHFGEEAYYAMADDYVADSSMIILHDGSALAVVD